RRPARPLRELRPLPRKPAEAGRAPRPASRNPRRADAPSDHRRRPSALGHDAPPEPHGGRHATPLAAVLGVARTDPDTRRGARPRWSRSALPPLPPRVPAGLPAPAQPL